MKTLYVISF